MREELETCKLTLTRSQETSRDELRRLAEELESCKSESSLELKSVREELTCARAESKRLYSEIDRLQTCAREEKLQLRHRSRVLLVSHLAASRARRLCSRKQSTKTTEDEAYPKWWCKIQETAREDSRKYLEERKNQMKCSKIPQKEK